MARRRKEKSLTEGIGGAVMMIVAFAILSPVFRGQLISTLSMVIAIAMLVGVVVLAVYLFKQMREQEPAPVRVPARNPVNHQILPQSSESQPRNRELSDVIEPIFRDPEQPPRPKQWDESVLSIIEWKRFEVVTKEFLKLTGYEAHETSVGADGGVDIRVTKPGNADFRGIVQCKAWNTYKVGVKPVRELFGIMAAEKVRYGMLITSGAFTSEAEEFAQGKIVLISGAKFLESIRKLPVDKQQQLLEVALEGDYQTPTCPQCDIKMKLRESRKGRSAGGQFWGCVNYPRCRQTLIYKED